MISDGQVVGAALRKQQCATCGTIRHVDRLSDAEIAAIYAGSYALPGLCADRQVPDYAKVICAALPPDARIDSILDIGCGSGALLRQMAGRLHPSRAIGLDPASNPISEAGGALRIIRGTTADLPDGAGFDLILSVNTIEHVSGPAAFLSTIAHRLAPDGSVIIICPAIEPSNDELLFFDHVWTLPPAALMRLGQRVGLTLDRTVMLEGRLAGFALYRLRRAGVPIVVAPVVGSPARYLEVWADLERKLSTILDEDGRDLDAFGAGQMAALVRAYAPEAFAKVQAFLVDDPAEAWPIGRVEKYTPARVGGGKRVLCLVHPRSFGIVATRIRGDGGVPIALPLEDTITAVTGGTGEKA